MPTIQEHRKQQIS